MAEILVIGDDTTADDLLEALDNLIAAERKATTELMRMYELREMRAVSYWRALGDARSEQLEHICGIITRTRAAT